MSQQPIDTNCMTLTRFVLAEQRRFGGSGDLSQLLTSIQSAVKAISAAVRRAGISQLFGAAGDTNVQGEEVMMQYVNSIKLVQLNFGRTFVMKTNKFIISISGEEVGCSVQRFVHQYAQILIYNMSSR